MARPLRLAFENATYHITARGNRRENIFYSDKDKAVFLEKMNETFEKYSFTCYAYCLMDNHYHSFIKTPHANISEGMHYLNASYTNWFKAEHKIVGVIFQGRYKSILVEEDSYGLRLSAYIHLNPLRARIVDDLYKYEWSSFLDYMGKRKSIDRLDAEFILRQFDEDMRKARRRYRRFVLENIEMDNPLEDSYRGVALGSEGFVDRIKGNIYHQLALYFIKRYTMMSLKEIGVEFGMDYAAVSQSCKRLEELVKRDESALRMKTMVEKELRN